MWNIKRYTAMTVLCVGIACAVTPTPSLAQCGRGYGAYGYAGGWGGYGYAGRNRRGRHIHYNRRTWVQIRSCYGFDGSGWSYGYGLC